MRNNVLLIAGAEQPCPVLHKDLLHAYNLFVACTLEEIFKVFEKTSIQLIICNVHLPAQDGWQLCRQFKTATRYAHIPVILLTTEDSLEVKIKALEAGADACMHPAMPWKYLDAQINNLIINRIKVSQHVGSSFPVNNNFPDLNNDEEFAKNLNSCICSHLHDPLLNVHLLARLMNMSRATLYRKIKTITNLTPNELINEARLNRAAEQLAAGGYKVFEIARMVGFQSQSSFGKAFLKQYKVTPAAWQRIKKEQRAQESSQVLQNTFTTMKRSLLAVAV
ncbi:MAG: helix-turn-helix domain-containing protein [Niastella sp.]|uniref:helix-turn-helix domain-containing protein n=1 Tax=Niastella sp. TaxID=1869183 RepID=UPI00389A190D